MKNLLFVICISVFAFGDVCLATDEDIFEFYPFPRAFVQHLQSYVFSAGNGFGSGVIVGTGDRISALTANHLIPKDPSPPLGPVPPRFVDPSRSSIFAFDYRVSGGAESLKAFLAYAPGRIEDGDVRMRGIPPESDFAVIHPLGRNRNLPPLQLARGLDNEDVLVLSGKRSLTAHSSGIVMSAEAANHFISESRQVDDLIPPYNKSAELFIFTATQMVGGSSGGGVFNTDGKLIGIIVRSGQTLDGQTYVRAVRTEYILEVYNSFLESLPNSADRYLYPMIGSRLSPLHTNAISCHELTQSLD